MRLLVVNPNSSVAATERIGWTASRAAAPGTSVVALSAPSGIPLIQTAEEAERAGAATAALLAERSGEFDAAVIAAYTDPGLQAARRLVRQPVVGIAEASMLAAAGHGRFVVLTPVAEIADLLRSLAERYGVVGRLAGLRLLPASFPALVADPEGHADLFRSACREAVEQDGVDAIVVAGGPLAGLAELLAPEVPVPLLDCVVCAVRRAEALFAAG